MSNIFIKIHDSIYNNTPAYKQLYADIKLLVDKYGNNLNILEVPTTTGNLANLLQQNHNITTIDISEEALQAALEKNNNIKTTTFNAYEKIPFANESFDGITSTHLLYFLNNKDNIMSGYYRILKPNGFLIITEFDGYINLIQTLKTSSSKKGIFTWKLADIIFNFLNKVSTKQYLTLNSLTILLKTHNFSVVHCYKSFGNLSNMILAQKNKINSRQLKYLHKGEVITNLWN
jgi:ubiquinone/menaquinone biosynthesis C-methylase UbiE